MLLALSPRHLFVSVVDWFGPYRMRFFDYVGQKQELLSKHTVHWREDSPVDVLVERLAVDFPDRLTVDGHVVGKCEHCDDKQPRLLANTTDCRHNECASCTGRNNGDDLSPLDEDLLPPECVVCQAIRMCPLALVHEVCSICHQGPLCRACAHAYMAEVVCNDCVSLHLNES